MTPATATDNTIPHGARRRGSSVSSAMCADASNPVKVQCACSSPNKNAHQYGDRPLLFTADTRNPTGCKGAIQNTAPTTTATP